MAQGLKNLDLETRKAWEENWRQLSVEQALEIFDYPRVKKNVGIFMKFMPKDRPVLEGGCGIGPYLIYFRSLGYGMVGMDYDRNALKKITGFDAKVPVCCADVSRVPFADASFGAYLSLGVIEHFSDGPARAVSEAFRVLVPGGYFIVHVPRFSIFQRLKYPVNLLKRNSFIRKILGKEPRRYYWEQYFSVSVLSGILKEAGFGIESVIPADHEHALMSFCSFLFRDKKSYDGPSRLGAAAGGFCEKCLPWSSADSMIFICKKPKNG